MTRHTAPMTDAYMTGLRLRNAARAKCVIKQMGTDYLLHPANNVPSARSVLHNLMMRACRAMCGGK